MKKKNEPDYDQAMAELQTILEEMQSGSIGLETMQARTARAMDLIRLCRDRLRRIGEGLDQLMGDAGETASPDRD